MFLLGWEVQAQLCSFTLVALVAFTSIWIALPVMLTWSFIATFVYFSLRRRGVPCPLDDDDSSPDTPVVRKTLRRSIGAIAGVWCAGLQAFAYTRVSRVLLSRSQGLIHRTLRVGVLGLGLTLFGVVTAEHLLRNAGYAGDRLLRLSLAGSLLHVPYRLLFSAAVIHLFWGFVTYVHI